MEFNNLVEGILQSLNETKEASKICLERKYPAKAPTGDSFKKDTGVPSRVDSRKSTTDNYVRTHKNPTTTHAKKFGKREDNEERKKGKMEEYDMGEVFDAIAADFADDMTKTQLEAKHGKDAVAKFIKYGDEDGHPSEDFIYQSPYDNTEAKLKAAAEEEGIYVNLDIEGGLVDPREVHDLLKDTPDGSPVTDDDVDRVLGGMKKPAEDAEYRGRKVSLNKPTRGDVKKFKVYVKDQKSGNVKKVNFGHGGTSAKRKGEKTMKIRKSNPKARKSFRARHNCDNPGPKTKARYWSCKKW